MLPESEGRELGAFFSPSPVSTLAGFCYWINWLSPWKSQNRALREWDTRQVNSGEKFRSQLQEVGNQAHDKEVGFGWDKEKDVFLLMRRHLLFSLWHKPDISEKCQRTSALLDAWCPNPRRGRVQPKLAEDLWNVMCSPPTIIYWQATICCHYLELWTYSSEQSKTLLP